MDELKKDARFAHITKDPRFRPASTKERKLKIDRRFSSMFKDSKFKMKYTVDKRGRPLIKERTTRDDMNKFYHLENDDDQSSSTSSDEEAQKANKKNKKALTGDDELDEFLKSDDSEEEVGGDEDEDNGEKDTSSSSGDDEDIPDVDDDDVEWNEFDEKCARSEETSRRLAVCNMDWDRIRAVDIFILLNSWKPADGVIKSVTIYPSEYGLQQMELENKIGPLPEVTQPVTKADQNETDSGHQTEDAEEEPDLPEVKSDDDEEVNGETFNQDDDPDVTDPKIREKLRKYQLNRLKYYYAIVECDTVETATRIYEECDGLEYETSAVRLDLRFIPDSVIFDGSVPPHDQCTEMPDKSVYKPILFRNTALTQTKVRCTWDETPIERRRLTRKKYTLEELEKVDLDAYLASESDDELPNDDDNDNAASDDNDEETEPKADEKTDENLFKVPTVPKTSKKNLPTIRAPSVLSSQDDIDRYRALLLDFNDESKDKKKTKKKISNFFDAEPSDEDDEIPRKTKPDDDDGDNDDDEDDPSDIDMEITWQPGLKAKVEEQFQKTTDKTKSKKHDQTASKSVEDDEEESVENEEETKNQRESLELLTAGDEIDGKKDFNLRQMMKAHKQSTKAAAKKNKRSKKSEENPFESTNGKSAVDQFQLNVDDKRFAAVYSRAAFNIDQSDPHFKATAGTQQIIEEKLKKRKLEQTNGTSRTQIDQDDLVAKLKRKSAKRDH